jgi:hypothetical protein
MLPCISVPVLLSLHTHLYFERGALLLPLPPLLIPHPDLIPHFFCTIVDHPFFAQGGGMLI